MASFESCAALEPRLIPLVAVARACPPDDWPVFSRTVKRPMSALVGWFAQGPAELRTSAAYNAVYRHLVDAWEREDCRDAA